MGQTLFTPKIDGNILYASEYAQIAQAINNIESAINMTVGSQLAKIPNASLASGISAAKIDPTTNLSIKDIATSGNLSVAGMISFGTTGYIEIKNGTTQILKIGPTSLVASDGSKTTFSVDSDGKSSLIGYVETDTNSKIRGELTATGDGTISGNLSVGGPTAFSLWDQPKINVGTMGKK